MDESPEVAFEEEVEVLTAKEHQIILHNDDVNTFDHVIRCLVRICEQTPEQAEQCPILSIITESVWSRQEPMKI